MRDRVEKREDASSRMELTGLLQKINDITAISIPVTKENNNTTLVWDNIPE